ncbi:serpin-ZX-like [Neltuma alba]|uniref:serpin-ZX-like n=1 Tax=Neltuma alba TaxID=207710 RepID=UPI0010A3BCF3|nr:serpin-ZX-like [Prosopis alba]
MASFSTYNSSFNTDFCLQLAYRVLQKQTEKGSNFVASPLSLHIILSLVAAGSKGKTLEQLLSFLGSESKDELNSLSSQFLSRLWHAEGTKSGGPNLSFVNGAWVEKTFGLKTSFEEIVKNVYKSQIEAVDFKNKAEEVAQEVNSWIENATNGLISHIVPSGSLNPRTRLVLANALYFKGAWDKRFDSSMTETRSFNLLNGENVKVPFMTSKRCGSYYYRSFQNHFNSFENYKVLSIPYQCGSNPFKFAMYFFLPHGKHGLPNLIHTLNSNPRFLNQNFELRRAEISELWIPKFKFSYNVEAEEAMKELGLTLPFMPGELTEVSDSFSSHKLHVSKILHKAFVEVDEEGTEAAACTIVSAIQCCASVAMPKISFVADHPFIFMIREETSKAVFFIGAVLNPLLDS